MPSTFFGLRSGDRTGMVSDLSSYYSSDTAPIRPLPCADSRFAEGGLGSRSSENSEQIFSVAVVDRVGERVGHATARFGKSKI